MREVNCAGCHVKMRYIKREKIQLGKTGWILGDLPNLRAGALDVDIYLCPRCRKIELYQNQSADVDGNLPQKACPNCGSTHDFDVPKCPFCGYRYYEK